MDTDTLELLRSSLRSLLAEPPRNIAAALEELGWAEVLAEDTAAGTSLLFEEQGYALASTAALDGVAAAALEFAPSTRLIWPHPVEGAEKADGHGRMTVCGVALGPLSADSEDIVVAAGDAVLRVDSATVTTTPLDTIDPAAGWLLVEGEADAGEPVGDWTAAVPAARLALAGELVGVSRRALGIACEHVSSRVQFGRAIGSYQSVRHRLAGAFSALTGAEALLSAAWTSGSAFAAAEAKAAAGRAHAEVVREAMQVCGGMGLSDEHPLPACVRRGYLLDTLLDSAREITRAHGAQLLGGLEPPRIGDF